MSSRRCPSIRFRFPRNALNWTTIAYVIWDDFDPESLTPGTSGSVAGLAAFWWPTDSQRPGLPGQTSRQFSRRISAGPLCRFPQPDQSDLQELNENWTVPVAKNAAEKRTFQISDKVPLLGVSFLPHEEASFVAGTGEIAIERRIGRGRIVATSFSLNAPLVRKWRSFPSFLNNVLLRRPSTSIWKNGNE